MADLTLVLQGREVRSFPLKPGATSIGRAPDNDIVINNLALSRRHAEVRAEGGEFRLFDLGSQNGVFLNGDRVEGGVTLGDQDTITLGTYAFVFRDPKQRRAERRAPSPAKPAPLLVLTFNDVELQRFSFPAEGRCLLGRASDCDIQIAERRLSRRHCEITREGDDYVLKDLGSQNGSYVNRRRVPKQQRLVHGDVLNFAEYAVLFLSDAEAYRGPDRPDSEVPAAPRTRVASEASGRPEEVEQGPVFVEPPARAQARKRSEARTTRPPRAMTPPPDIEDPNPSPPPDDALDSWYATREAEAEPEPEESVLLERNSSAVSEVLGTMMLDKEEVDERLQVEPAARRFSVEVHTRGQLSFSGPITRDVTVMGREPEADIRLDGRYVAGRHSLLVRVRDSLLLVRLGSSSAARVNGLPKLQAFLRDGDVIEIDETSIKISEI